MSRKKGQTYTAEQKTKIVLELLRISRSSYYYKPAPMSETDLKSMHAIDEIATDNSEYGYRMIHQHLLEDGHSIGKTGCSNTCAF